MKRLYMTMKGMGLLLVVGFLLSSCSSNKVLGLEQGWDVLDQRKVNFVRDHDAIEIKSRTPYTALRFKVEDKDVRINELKIVFDNGDKLEPVMDDVITAGQWSRIIELGREGRVINSIEFKYRSLGNLLTGRATVITIGRRYDPYRYGY
ncbi:MAG: hypothetical protein ACO1OO_09820 [Flavisolibacter sp.]